MFPSNVLDDFRKGKLELWRPKMIRLFAVSCGLPGEEACVYRFRAASGKGKARDELVRLVRSWDGEQRIGKRALGALKSMRAIRAKDKLFALKDEEVVRAQDIDAWDAIRNRGAHARPPEEKELQEWIDNAHRVEVLLNNLVLKAIGYQGQFTDYGSEGWPVAQYPLADSPA